MGIVHNCVLSCLVLQHYFYGSTALHRACSGGHLEVVEYLIAQKADLNAYDKVSSDAMIHDEFIDRYDAIPYTNQSC